MSDTTPRNIDSETTPSDQFAADLRDDWAAEAYGDTYTPAHERAQEHEQEIDL